jgi:ParB-like chromosome segregation protein Spo0J
MEVKLINIDKIKPYDKNPRINDNAVDKVAESIKQFGFKQPIVVDSNSVVIVGHTRLRAAQKLKIKEVPVLVADDLSDEKAKAYRLADNKTNEFSEWDIELLQGELMELNDFEIDMSDFGFDYDELNKSLNDDDEHSDKNKELDINNFEDEMILKLKYTEDDYNFVCKKLGGINEKHEIALLNLLKGL